VRDRWQTRRDEPRHRFRRLRRDVPAGRPHRQPDRVPGDAPDPQRRRDTERPGHRHRRAARAVELGVDHIDTAAFSFSARRSANELINRALAPYRDEVLIVTKVGPGRDPSGEWLPLAAPEQLRGQAEEHLRHHLAEARAIAPVVCVQNRYGIGAPEHQDELLDACGAQGIAFVPFFAIAGEGREAGATRNTPFWPADKA
jgi:aryl-alcohol dehydrogenase-like predicted oxidoreductase